MWSRTKNRIKSAFSFTKNGIKSVFSFFRHKAYSLKARVYRAGVSLTVAFMALQSRVFASAGGSMDLGAGSSFFTSAIDTLKLIVIAIGIGLGGWGIVNLLEGYGNDNPGAKSQGIKQLMSGAGIAVVGAVLIPKIADLF